MAPSISLYYNQTMLYSWKSLLTLHVICVKTIWPMSDLKPSPENSRNEDFKKVWHCFLAWIFPELQTFLWRSLLRKIRRLWAQFVGTLFDLWVIWSYHLFFFKGDIMSDFVGASDSIVCLIGPSFTCLIHFFKREITFLFFFTKKI